MRNIIWDLTFIYDILQKNWPIAGAAGILVLVLGLVFGKLSMVIAGAIVLFVVIIDLLILLVRRLRARQ